MKQLTRLVFVVVTLLMLTSKTDSHFKSMHADSLSLPLGYQQTSILPSFGQLPDIKTSLAVHKTVAFMTFLASSPKLMCIVPPVLIAEFLTQLSCNPSILNAIPHHLLASFMASLSANPTLVNAIPRSVFVSISSTLSVGSPVADGIATGPVAGPPNTDIIAVPSAPSAPNVPGVSVTKEVTAVVSPPSAPSVPSAPNVPGVSVTKEVTAVVSPPSAPSVPSAPNVPGVSVTKEVTAVVSPSAPVLPADLPTTGGGLIYQSAVSPLSTLPGTPCNIPAVETPPIALPPAIPILPALPTLPIPSLPAPTMQSPLSFLSTLFNKGAGNSVLEAKILAIFRLLASSHLKLPQLPHAPPAQSGSIIVPKKPATHVVPESSKVFILLPAPLLGKKPIDLASAQPSKLFYNPGSVNQIVDFVHQLGPKKLSLPKLTVPHPVVPANPIKCLPIFSKVPC